MKVVPLETLALLNRLNVTRVELGGFLNQRADDVKQLVEQHRFSVCGIHGPTLTLDRKCGFYTTWAERYLPFFKTNCLTLETAPALFADSQRSEWATIFNSISELLIEIAGALGPNFKLSYHCVDHDFALFNGQPLVARLFDHANIPPNFGLQLDTFWLHRAGIHPTILSSWMVHSIQLNERDDEGHCCLLGTHPERCAEYARSLAGSMHQVDWILENDPVDAIARSKDPLVMRTISDCVLRWPEFWASISNCEQNKDSRCWFAKEDGCLPTASPASSYNIISPAQTSPNLLQIYDTEFGEAMTEFLFGEARSLTPLKFDDPRVRFYIDKRQTSDAIPDAVSFQAEQELFEKFWPPAPSSQVIHIVGGTGSGKSTFIRFFFQYFLPHRALLQARLPSASFEVPTDEIFAAALRKHVILYIDLRRPDPEGLRQCVFRRLRESLLIEAANRNLEEVLLDQEFSSVEDWVMRNSVRLAQQVEGASRKWYISWVFDNSDQLDEKSQGDLVGLIHDFIPEEKLSAWATGPVVHPKLSLWRIIVPIRPETQRNLMRFWTPFHSSDVLNLFPIDHHAFIRARADMLTESVTRNQRHLSEDLYCAEVPRAYLEIKTPDEMAGNLHDLLLVAAGQDGKAKVISGHATTILDQFVNNSARRRLLLIRRAASSPVIRVRLDQGRQHNWSEEVSDFYFFDGLIRADAPEFSADAACPILNLYGLGSTSVTPHSVFVGLHSMYLLEQGKRWTVVKASLRRIGYDDSDIHACEQWLVRLEIIKPIYDSGHLVELPIVQGHWALLRERAYTDNMAIACARMWGTAGQARFSDVLDPSQFLIRVNGSIWFMQRIWASERAVATFPKDSGDRCGTFTQFADFFDKLRLPSVTYFVAQGYLSRLRNLARRSGVRQSMMFEKNQEWEACFGKLEELVLASGRTRTMTARR